jgi:hypothetical protein
VVQNGATAGGHGHPRPDGLWPVRNGDVVINGNGDHGNGNHGNGNHVPDAGSTVTLLGMALLGVGFIRHRI